METAYAANQSIKTTGKLFVKCAPAHHWKGLENIASGGRGESPCGIGMELEVSLCTHTPISSLCQLRRPRNNDIQVAMTTARAQILVSKYDSIESN